MTAQDQDEQDYQRRVDAYIHAVVDGGERPSDKLEERLGLTPRPPAFNRLAQAILSHPRGFDFERASDGQLYRFLEPGSPFAPHVRARHLVEVLTTERPEYDPGRAWKRAAHAAARHPLLDRDLALQVLAHPSFNPESYRVLASERPELLDREALRTVLARPTSFSDPDATMHKMALEAGLVRRTLQPDDVAELLDRGPAQLLAALHARYPDRRLHAGPDSPVEKGGAPLTAAHLERAMQHAEDPRVLRSLIYHPNTSGDQLDRLLPLVVAGARTTEVDGSAGMVHGVDDETRQRLDDLGGHPNLQVPTIDKMLSLRGPAAAAATDAALRSRNVTPEQVRQALASPDPVRVGRAARHVAGNPATDPDTLRQIHELADGDQLPERDRDAVLDRLANNKATPSDVIGAMVRTVAEDLDNVNDAQFHNNAALAEALGQHPNVTLDDLRSISRYFTKDSPGLARLATESPDEFQGQLGKQPGRVQPALGTNRLRRARDHILATGRPSLKPKEMPPGDWSVGRLPNGNISAAKLQEAIDRAPKLRFNTTYGQWGTKYDKDSHNSAEGATRADLTNELREHRDAEQRHSSKLSRVFQLNLTNDHVRQMKEAGVWESFQKLHELSKQSGHPVGPGGVGWVRWTGSPKKERALRQKIADAEAKGQWPSRLTREQVQQAKASQPGIFVDEVQSDLGQALSRVAAGQARQPAEEEEAVPAAHTKKISEILFAGHKPNEVIAEAFLQHLRDKGLHHVPVHMHSPETKGAVLEAGEYLQLKCPTCIGHGEAPGLQGVHEPCPDCEGTGRRPMPAHMLHTYGQLPPKLGMAPAKYGDLATEDNPRLQGKPTWGSVVRKAEETDLGEWFGPVRQRPLPFESDDERQHVEYALVMPHQALAHAANHGALGTPERVAVLHVMRRFLRGTEHGTTSRLSGWERVRENIDHELVGVHGTSQKEVVTLPTSYLSGALRMARRDLAVVKAEPGPHQDEALQKGVSDYPLTDKGRDFAARRGKPATLAQATHGDDAYNHELSCGTPSCKGCSTPAMRTHGPGAVAGHSEDCTDPSCGRECASMAGWFEPPRQHSRTPQPNLTPFTYSHLEPMSGGRFWDFSQAIKNIRSPKLKDAKLRVYMTDEHPRVVTAVLAVPGHNPNHKGFSFGLAKDMEIDGQPHSIEAVQSARLRTEDENSYKNADGTSRPMAPNDSLRRAPGWWPHGQELSNGRRGTMTAVQAKVLRELDGAVRYVLSGRAEPCHGYLADELGKAERVHREGYVLEPSQGDGWKITSPHGHIDYRSVTDTDGEPQNEIWWVESHKKGHGSQLVDWMQQEHPAQSVAWGVTSHAGEQLRQRWHAAHPDVQSVTGPHEGQFDPYQHGEEQCDWCEGPLDDGRCPECDGDLEEVEKMELAKGWLNIEVSAKGAAFLQQHKLARTAHMLAGRKDATEVKLKKSDASVDLPAEQADRPRMEHSDGKDVRRLLRQPQVRVAPATVEDQLHELAGQQHAQDQAVAAQAETKRVELLREVAGVLRGVEAQLPQLEQVRGQNPQLYATVVGLARGVAALGRALKGEGGGQLRKVEDEPPNDDDPGTCVGCGKPGQPASLGHLLHALRPKLAAAAQREYDAWEQDDDGLDEDFGGGGICDQVSDAMKGVLHDHLGGIETTDGGQDGDDHAFPLVYDRDRAYAVDIPPHVYESGGGYRWSKTPDVQIGPDDVAIEPLDRTWLAHSGFEQPEGPARGAVCASCAPRTRKAEDEPPAEDLGKAVRDLPPGRPRRDGASDYSHHLSPEDRRAGLRLVVKPADHYRGDEWEDMVGGKIAHVAELTHNGASVGHVIGADHGEGSFWPHAHLDDGYQGRGLGKAMYQALFRHMADRGYTRVAGMIHSPASGRVHAALAREHGLDYRPLPVDEFQRPGPVLRQYGIDPAEGPSWKGPYEYELKGELEPVRKAFDVPDGTEVAPSTWNYSHLLPAALRGRVKVTLEDAQHPSVRATVGRRLIGEVNSLLWGGVVEPHSNVVEEYQRQGVGLAMYEALLHHCAKRRGAKVVAGDASPEAAGLHLKLAAKHGLRVAAQDEADGWRYRYDLGKNQPPPSFSGLGTGGLAKALADLPVGRPEDPADESTHYDYSHLLHPRHRVMGYSLRVFHNPDTGCSQAALWHKTPSGEPKQVGDVLSVPGGAPRSFEPHSNIDKPHQGKGLGQAMYEALYAHNARLGMDVVAGDKHSEAAARVHRKLAQKHGWQGYAPPANPNPKYPHGRYSYTIKAEDRGTAGLAKAHASAAQGLPPADRSAYVDMDDWEAQLRGQYVRDGQVVASSRTTPWEGQLPPYGTWAIDPSFPSPYGYDVAQLQELDPDQLHPKEVTEHQKLEDVDRYAEWSAAGRQAPPIRVLQTYEGNLQIANGHRRWLAAKKNGSKVAAWVYPTMEHPTEQLDGRPRVVPMTHELVHKAEPEDDLDFENEPIGQGFDKNHRWQAAGGVFRAYRDQHPVVHVAWSRDDRHLDEGYPGVSVDAQWAEPYAQTGDGLRTLHEFRRHLQEHHPEVKVVHHRPVSQAGYLSMARVFGEPMTVEDDHGQYDPGEERRALVRGMPRTAEAVPRGPGLTPSLIARGDYANCEECDGEGCRHCDYEGYQRPPDLSVDHLLKADWEKLLAERQAKEERTRLTKERRRQLRTHTCYVGDCTSVPGDWVMAVVGTGKPISMYKLASRIHAPGMARLIRDPSANYYEGTTPGGKSVLWFKHSGFEHFFTRPEDKVDPDAEAEVLRTDSGDESVPGTTSHLLKAVDPYWPPRTTARLTHGDDAWQHGAGCGDPDCKGKCLVRHAHDCTDKGCAGACVDGSNPVFPDTRTWDYSHVLPPRMRAVGYKLHVTHNPMRAPWALPGEEQHSHFMTARLSQSGPLVDYLLRAPGETEDWGPDTSGAWASGVTPEGLSVEPQDAWKRRAKGSFGQPAHEALRYALAHALKRRNFVVPGSETWVPPADVPRRARP